jgi:hypothetical protein
MIIERRFFHRILMVVEEGLELLLSKKPDFESSVSTNSSIKTDTTMHNVYKKFISQLTY